MCLDFKAITIFYQRIYRLFSVIDLGDYKIRFKNAKDIDLSLYKVGDKDHLPVCYNALLLIRFIKQTQRINCRKTHLAIIHHRYDLYYLTCVKLGVH